MRLPGSSLRTGAEAALRGLGLGLLVWALVLAFRAGPRAGEEQTGSAELRAALTRWSTVTAPLTLRANITVPPSAVERDWLHALGAAGSLVQWSGDRLSATAVSVAARSDPAGGVLWSAVAPRGAMIVLTDTLGARDSAIATALPMQVTLDRLEQGTAAAVGAVMAHDSPSDSLTLHRLLVLGRAGWETRFVAAALEERGWLVDVRYAVAPSSDVYQGLRPPQSVAIMPSAAAASGPQFPGRFPPGNRFLGGLPQPQFAGPGPSTGAPAETAVRIAIDTAHYSAVLAIDSTAARYGGAIRQYLKDGGGLLLWPEAAGSREFSPVAAGGAGVREVFERTPFTDSLPRAALELVPIARLHRDAVVLESRAGQPSIAARRVGTGRVLQVGYEDDWRWRLAGGAAAVDGHRRWLAGLVAGVAYVGRTPLVNGPDDPAPLGSLIDRLGEPVAQVTPVPAAIRNLSAWLFALMLGGLLAEWTSRRLAGRA